jgi:hypothetical protein|tara:strand:+ start:269 stop:595 length:327 start_codon:yes stop_codon:yes gene_type:complete
MIIVEVLGTGRSKQVKATDAKPKLIKPNMGHESPHPMQGKLVGEEYDPSKGGFEIPNLFKWAIAKYPTLTLGQLEKNMPALQREYGQEKAMRKVNQKHRPSVTPADIK